MQFLVITTPSVFRSLVPALCPHCGSTTSFEYVELITCYERNEKKLNENDGKLRGGRKTESLEGLSAEQRKKICWMTGK